MSRIVMWGSAAIVTAAAALFIPLDSRILEYAGVTATDVDTTTPQRPPTTPPTRSISAALTDSSAADPGAPATNAAGSTAPYAPPASPLPSQRPAASRYAAAPASLPSDAAPTAFTGSRVLASTAAPASEATIRALQRELQRHGCYDGIIDGDWGPASRYAAATFTQSLNAALPVDTPDAALLALARRHPSPACGPNNGATTGLTTTATAPVGAAAATTMIGVAAARTTDTATDAAASPLTRAPRIVPSNGSPPAATVIPIDPTAISPGERARRMALGIELPPGEPGAAPVTRPPAVERTTSAERQQRARRQRARANRQARRTRWRQQVFRSIDLSGN